VSGAWTRCCAVGVVRLFRCKCRLADSGMSHAQSVCTMHSELFVQPTVKSGENSDSQKALTRGRTDHLYDIYTSDRRLCSATFILVYLSCSRLFEKKPTTAGRTPQRGRNVRRRKKELRCPLSRSVRATYPRYTTILTM